MDSQLKTGEVPITNNLDAALRHLRYEESPRYLWIDALCINQANNAEKSKQVATMGTIFRNADRVTAWLGPKESNSDLAMAWFLAIGRKLDVDWSTRTIRPRIIESTGGPTDQQEQDLTKHVDLITRHRIVPWTDEEARAIVSVLARSYFERAWIVQEIRLAKHVFFQCGERIISEKYLWTSAMALNGRYRIEAAEFSFERWQEARQRLFLLANGRMRKTGESIFTLRSNLGSLFCNDARDKVYSALGLMTPFTQNWTIVPTYTQPTEEVYRNIARRAITQSSHLEILSDCELSSRVLDIPSWVPDWSTPSRHRAMDTRWSACAYIAGRPSFDASGMRCTVSGVFRSRIIRIEDRETLEGAILQEELWASIRSWRPTTESLNVIYLTGERLIEVYCRTFVRDLFLDGRPNFAKSLDLLQKVWCGEESSSKDEFDKDSRKQQSYFRDFYQVMRSRRLFRTSSGHIGISPAETKIDDIVCILLGCRFPVVLRPAPGHTYQVVGICYVHGLAKGEAVYHNRSASTSQSEGSESGTWPELFDPETGHNKYDLEVMLEKAGLRVDAVQKEYPQACSVSNETLLAAGIQVEDFVLV